MLRLDHRELRNSLVQLGWVVVGGGMWANTETSRSSARAGAATTMSIFQLQYGCNNELNNELLFIVSTLRQSYS